MTREELSKAYTLMPHKAQNLQLYAAQKKSWYAAIVLHLAIVENNYNLMEGLWNEI